MFEETLYQSCADGTPFVDALKKQGIVPGIKVDTGLQVLNLHMLVDPPGSMCTETRDQQKFACCHSLPYHHAVNVHACNKIILEG